MWHPLRSGGIRPSVRSTLVVIAALLVAMGAAAQEQPVAARDDVDDDGLGSRDVLIRTEVVRLDWTPLPGAFELALRRRHANPLFPTERQFVGEADLKGAKIQDAADAWEVLDDFLSVQLGRKKLARLRTADEVGKALKRIDSVVRRTLEVGGQASRLTEPLRVLRADLLEEWRAPSLEDEALAKLLKGASQSRRPGESDLFVAQLLRKNSPIESGEWAAAILSEPPSTIAVAMSALSRKRRSSVQREGTALLRRLDELGVEVNDSGEKRAVLLR